MLAPVLALALVCTLSLPASAFFWNKKTDVPSVSDFSKNGMVGQVISFSAGDFPVSGGSNLCPRNARPIATPACGISASPM